MAPPASRHVPLSSHVPVPARSMFGVTPLSVCGRKPSQQGSASLCASRPPGTCKAPKVWRGLAGERRTKNRAAGCTFERFALSAPPCEAAGPLRPPDYAERTWLGPAAASARCEQWKPACSSRNRGVLNGVSPEFRANVSSQRGSKDLFFGVALDGHKRTGMRY